MEKSSINSDGDVPGLPGLSKEEIDDLLKKLYCRLKDFVSLDVITIKGDYTVKDLDSVKKNDNTENNIDTCEENDVIKIARSLGARVLAQTHMKLDGDTLNAIATDNVGNMSNADIMDFHNKVLKTALENRKDRFELLVEFISNILGRRQFAPSQ